MDEKVLTGITDEQRLILLWTEHKRLKMLVNFALILCLSLIFAVPGFMWYKMERFRTSISAIQENQTKIVKLQEGFVKDMTKISELNLDIITEIQEKELESIGRDLDIITKVNGVMGSNIEIGEQGGANLTKPLGEVSELKLDSTEKESL